MRKQRDDVITDIDTLMQESNYERDLRLEIGALIVELKRLRKKVNESRQL